MMPSHRVLFLLILSPVLAACGKVHAPLPTMPPTVSPSLQPSPLPTATFTPSPTPSVTFSPTPTPVPCDPAATYCIVSGHFFLDRPIALPGLITVDPTYLYGTTQDGSRAPHHGDEFYNASGTPVLAAADGTVVVAGTDKATAYGPVTDVYGNLVVIEHHFPGVSKTMYTLYGHLSLVGVQVGQVVRAGKKIGEVGASGEAIGSHLHFEVREGENNYDSNRNPLLWLKPLTGADGNPLGVIAGRLVDGEGKPIHITGLNVQYYPDPAGAPAAAYPVETYASEDHPVQPDDAWGENFSLGDLPAGDYRLSLVWAGKVLEHWIKVQPGMVTVVTFAAK